jgi:hypothetical protein
MQSLHVMTTYGLLYGDMYYVERTCLDEKRDPFHARVL